MTAKQIQDEFALPNTPKYICDVKIDAVEDSINGLKVIDGKVGGKVPINEYNELRDLSIHNKSSNSITLGKYRPTINADGSENWKVPGPDSYNTLAKNDGNMYFDMGSTYDEAMKKYNLSYQEMFDYFNVPVLNYDRGHFGCSISLGTDAISLDSDKEWDDNEELHEFWADIDEQLKLRIPDKFLEANGWK